MSVCSSIAIASQRDVSFLNSDAPRALVVALVEHAFLDVAVLAELASANNENLAALVALNQQRFHAAVTFRPCSGFSESPSLS